MIQVTITAIDGTAISPSRIRPIAQSQLVSPFMAPSTEGDTGSAAILFVPKTVNGQTTVEKWTISATFAATLTALSADNAIEGAALAADKDASNGFAGLTLFKLNMKNVAGTIISWFTNTNTAARTYTLQDRDGTIADDTDLATKQSTSGKDATGGYAGLTLFKINFKNALNTFTSFFTNSNTAARTYTFQDRDGTIADDTDLATKIDTSAKDATGGVAGLTLFKINFKNAANTFTNFFTNATTAARTYTFPDKDGTVAMTNEFAKLSTTALVAGSSGAIGDALITANSAVSVTRLTQGGTFAPGGYEVALSAGVGYTITARKVDGTLENACTDTVCATIVY